MRYLYPPANGHPALRHRLLWLNKPQPFGQDIKTESPGTIAL